MTNAVAGAVTPGLRPGRDRLLLVLAALWLVAVAIGVVAVWRYKMTAGPAVHAPAEWPGESHLARSSGKPTLLMIAHPRCSCTRASLAELERLLAETGHEARTHVVFVKPAGTPAGWEQTDSYRRASSIPGVEVFVDEGGVEAERFGASASGETILYDAAGHQLFHGGITGARGHEGENAGRSRIRSLMQTGAADRRDSPTFGCELSEANDGDPKQTTTGKGR